MLKTSTEETAEVLVEAKKEIDKVFGEGYAEHHPELLAAFISSACTYETCIGAGMVEELSIAINLLAQAIQEYSQTNKSGFK